MKEIDRNSLKYLTIDPNDNGWNFVVTTVGRQAIEPNEEYPAMKHPDTYDFGTQNGRILDEFQIVYISEGKGYFESQSMPRQRVEAGTAIMLFPNERHHYAPDKQYGWCEYWVGFKGTMAERFLSEEFFSRERSLVKIGMSNSLMGLYRDAVRIAERDDIGTQQLLTGIVVHMLGIIIHKQRGLKYRSNRTDDIIIEARQLMRERVHHTLRAEDIATTLGVGYSWFRQTFKRVTGIAPSRYISLLLISRAKELLISEHQTISEIAYSLGFESVGQFATLFRKVEGVTPRQFRNDNRLDYNNDTPR